MKYLLNVAYLLAAALYSPVVIYRRLRHGRYNKGFADRRGRITRKNPDKKCIWIHAVSVGEVNATRTIVTKLQQQFPDHEILITTTTDTGYARADSLYGNKLQICYFPFDFSWTMYRAFVNINPGICILMELEVWPNFAKTAHERKVPIIVANGRISDRSYGRYKKIKTIAARMFKRIDLILAQTEQYAQRFRELGCDDNKVVVTGSLKYDTAQVAEKIDGANELADKLNIAGDKLWVVGGTGNDEEKPIIEVYKELIKDDRFKDIRLVIVPRKPERFDEVAQLIEDNGFPLIRYSKIKSASNSTNERQVTSDKRRIVLGDTMGDLRKFYSLATIIFVGRSLVPMGGSDMMESAALGKCTIFGTGAFNFKQTVDALLDGNGAIQVGDKDELLAALQKCLSDDSYRQQIADNGRQVIKDNQGATEKTIELIGNLLNG